MPGKSAPSRKRSPKWPPQRPHRISAPARNSSAELSTATAGSCVANDGQPVPLSNLAADENSGTPQPAQRNSPGRFSLTSGERVGRLRAAVPQDEVLHTTQLPLPLGLGLLDLVALGAARRPAGRFRLRGGRDSQCGGRRERAARDPQRGRGRERGEEECSRAAACASERVI